MDLVVLGAIIGAVRGVAEAVLVPQFVLDLLIDLIDRLLLADLEHASAGFLGNALEHLLAVRMFSLGFGARRITSAAPGIAASGIAPAPRAIDAAAPVAPASLSLVGVRVGEQDRIHDGVGALRGFYGAVERHLAALVHPVGENDDGLPP